MSDSSNLLKTTVNDYLENLPESVHNKLYQSSITCLAIFRLLPSLAKFYVMSLLFNEHSVSYIDLTRWIRPDNMTHLVSSSTKSSSSSAVTNFPGAIGKNKMYQNECLKRLKQLNLIKDVRKQWTNPNTGQLTNVVVLQLNPMFRKNFRNALTGSQMSNDLNNDIEMTDVEEVSEEFLDRYSLMKWENILHFMVGSEVPELPSIGVLSLLRHSGLMDIGEENEFIATPKRFKGDNMDLKSMKITQDGFQFLLQDINAQIWQLLLQYLRMSEKLMMNPVDVLNFIFMLGSLELGKQYPVTLLSDTQVIMLEDLVDYGLIYYPEKNRYFYPTRMATTLTSEKTTFKTASMSMNQVLEGGPEVKDHGSIVLETNFKLYCYTTSPLQIAILNLFVHLRTRFANMVTGMITRESVREALRNGITADQIIKYLETHAHSQMKKLAEEKLLKKLEFDSNATETQQIGSQVKLEVIPPTVVDQIKLWQLEMDRLQTFAGFLFKDFANAQEFEQLANYADEVGVMLWRDDDKRKFFVTEEGIGQLNDYANRLKRHRA
ncbi:TFIIH and nucleotide excision repair factor 3 complexes subunit [Komagataella phaffii CBS 7435]|uniref:RNA polymerase II transcription factor B subunit 2 n=2 Tax=Komagataella phaffii TaxID=460519 RepID=C4R792_KOMPG|nr:uncharacterized protein PAS_chr4_0238 [Komagataella phaffii GS115]AOA65153.1 GQ67_04561T0 [Komagataella phaffii]CAH2451160.1 TFIIH and nucleotide excision repair factor 3 complexes subunit [Komagataella phaffii CBS 7435]AOA70383.1 GQ68_04533T0 [Komagataella phaffii GS115]CAY71467.1 Subunit of TFIIH and nucleotide excision repair factor 3 complexes [Komagataella phaffii GS115]CCA40923.1 TFIIH and nucleotide excision repair factor 3 complexes subunit [Komagataella phaffii CBS 7435]